MTTTKLPTTTRATPSLRNLRHELFCQAFTGEAWGNAAEAYRRAGYTAKNSKVAGNNALRLMEKDGIRERVKELRSAIQDRLCFDRMELAQLRLNIARNPNQDTGHRLAAIRDLEKSMGWQAPDKLKVELDGFAEIWAAINGTSRGALD